MEKAGCDGLEEHKREHAQFISRVGEMATRFLGSTSPKDASEIVHFLYDWLITHVHETDMKYSSQLRGYEVE
jgi:hemerythrin-like metal-binding protein